MTLQRYKVFLELCNTRYYFLKIFSDGRSCISFYNEDIQRRYNAHPQKNIKINLFFVNYIKKNVKIFGNYLKYYYLCYAEPGEGNLDRINSGDDTPCNASVRNRICGYTA